MVSPDGGTAAENAATTKASGDENGATAVCAVVPGAVLREAFQTMEALVAECRVRFGPDGMTMRATDPAKAALVAVRLDGSAFESYQSSDVTVGLQLERVSEIVSLSDGLVSLTLTPDSRRLTVTSGGVAYDTTVLDPERVRDAPERASLETEFGYDATFTTTSDELSRAISATDMIADSLVVRGDTDETTDSGKTANNTASGDGAIGGDAATTDEATSETPAIVFEATGDTDECAVRLPRESLTDASLGPAESIISLDYLTVIDRVLPSDTDVTVFAGRETPIAMEYGLADGVSVEWLVSPRIER